jgi:hypothetical protein
VTPFRLITYFLAAFWRCSQPFLLLFFGLFTDCRFLLFPFSELKGEKETEKRGAEIANTFATKKKKKHRAVANQKRNLTYWMLRSRFDEKYAPLRH